MPNLASLLDRSLPDPARAVLRNASRIAYQASGTASEIYLVGGLVRDLLRGVASADIDLSVVGDGPAFAGALAGELEGKVVSRSEFGTAAVQTKSFMIDVATARAETYARPGALPDVVPSGIEDDLARRDFTVNAMAVDLSPAGWGDLLDPHGGMADVTMRRIRTLHPDSFADDPTRALRAVRYEARLGFRVGPRTAEEIRRHSGHFDAVSPARILAEVKRILAEPTRAVALRRADELGVLGSVSPAFRIGGRSLKAIDDSTDRDALFHVALIGAGLTRSEAAVLVARIEPPAEWREVLEAGPAYRDIARLLDRPDLRRSEIADLLAGFPVCALEAQLQLAPDSRQKIALRSWLESLRFVKPLLTGDDLLRAGVPEGPLVGRLLDELRRAVLDRAARSREDELAIVKRRLPALLAHDAANRE